MSSFDAGGQFIRGSTSSSADLPSVCPVCQSSSITTTAKSPNANTYWRCGKCGEIWNVSRRQLDRSGRTR
jgi:predicted Zn finger-like uncharacterized protein